MTTNNARMMRAISTVASTRVLIAVLLCCGFYGLYVSAKMAHKFGSTISPEHASGLVLITILAAFIFAARDIFKSRGDKTMAFVAGALGVMFVSAELWSHIGYTVGQRHGNVVGATVQKAKFDDNRDSVDQAKRDIVSAQARLDELQKQNGWAASVSADALRAKLESLNLAIKLEAERGGCKARCLERTKERDELASRIAILEERTSLDTKIAAAKAWLEKAKVTAANTDVGESSVVEQALLPAKLISMSLDPDKNSVGWAQIFIGLFMAVIQTALAPGAITTAFRLANVSHTDDIPTAKPSDKTEIVVEKPEPKALANVTRLDGSTSIAAAARARLNGMAAA